MTPSQRAIGLLVFLSITAVLLRLATRRIPVPFPVVLAVAGLVGGAVPTFPVTLFPPEAILVSFIPGLVFEGALNIDIDRLKRVAPEVAAFATVGVLATVAAVAVTTRAVLGVDWIEALLLGAILAPTDPVAIVAVLRGGSAPRRLTTMLEGESLFNDGTGIAVFAAVMVALSAGSISASTVAMNLATITVGGILVGGACAAAGSLLLRATDDPATEVLISLAMAYGSYFIADVLGVSGVVATVTVGVAVATVERRTMIHSPQMRDTWALQAYILNALLFLLVGSQVSARAIAGQLGPVLAVVLTMLIVRAAMVVPVMAARRRHRIALRWQSLVVWGGMRGALSVALALSISERTDIDPRLATVGCGAAILSLILQGSTAPALARRLGPQPPPHDSGEHGAPDPVTAG